MWKIPWDRIMGKAGSEPTPTQQPPASLPSTEPTDAELLHGKPHQIYARRVWMSFMEDVNAAIEANATRANGGDGEREKNGEKLDPEIDAVTVKLMDLVDCEVVKKPLDDNFYTIDSDANIKTKNENKNQLATIESGSVDSPKPSHIQTPSENPAPVGDQKIAAILDAVLQHKDAQLTDLEKKNSLMGLFKEDDLLLKPTDDKKIHDSFISIDRSPSSKSESKRSKSMFFNSNNHHHSGTGMHKYLEPLPSVNNNNIRIRAKKDKSKSKKLKSKEPIPVPTVQNLLTKLPEGFGIDDYGFVKPLEEIKQQELRVNEEDIPAWEKILREPNKRPNDKKLLKLFTRGVPKELRGDIWFLFSRSYALDNTNPGFWLHSETCTLLPEVENAIRKDLHRQINDHFLFYVDHLEGSDRNSYGQQELFRVLKAISLFDQKAGYCQAHGPIGAALIIHTYAERAFWILSFICSFYLPNYFENLDHFITDSQVFKDGLSKYCKAGSKMLRQLNIHIYFLTEWFMCIYLRTFPFTHALIVFDLFIFKGKKILFQVGYSLIDQIAAKKPNDEVEFNNILAKIKTDDKFIDFDKMLNNALSLDVKTKWIQHKTKVLLRKKMKESNQHSEQAKSTEKNNNNGSVEKRKTVG